jgi:transcriptional regulator with XRE-family HTH domain
MSSVKPSSEGIQKVKLLMAEMIRPDKPDQKGWTQANLAERSGADLSTVKRFLKGESVKFDSLVWITGAVGLKPEDVIDAPLNETEANIVNWIAICGEMLAKQKEARQLRKEATAIGAEVNVYVPLDLLEHKEQTRSKQEKADSDQRNQYQERKVVKTYEHNDFLKSLTDRQSKNKHITIVGEAGAGKTTLLARIADELDKNQKLQIFVSLADLRERSLEDHIYGNWLSKALGVQKDSINAEQKNDLFQQFQSGEIWLLLDGLDEMRAKSSADALEKINREIKEVIGQSQVVLTSRLNVWDAYLNRLSGFDTFRMGDFSPEQVDKFISDWFIGAKKPESAPILQAKLKEPNRDRIRDMVRHPLRLALLCQAFYRDLNTELPETKAGLYELFVRYFYEWKPNIVDEDLTQDTLREELHLALGKLAIAGIDGDAGFRLSRSLAVKEMGDRLFKLASDVGWLTLIERDEQDQEVYAFYHASFQEYFAALAIDDWDFFIPRDHVDKPLQDRKYRIFDPQWRHCFFLWIGQEKRIPKNSKEELIRFLWEFKDNCGRFYSRRAKCIATSSTGEFRNCDNIFAQNIIKKTLKASWDTSIGLSAMFHARLSLLEANPIQVLEALEYLINSEEVPNIHLLRFHFGKDWIQNQEVIGWLSENYSTTKSLDSYFVLELSKQTSKELRKECISNHLKTEFESYFLALDEDECLAFENAMYVREYQENQDKLIVNKARSVEGLIEIYHSIPLKNEFLVIDRIIEDYPDSDHSIEFIVNILSPPLDIHSIRYHQGIYDISMTFEKLPEKLSKRLITEFGRYITNKCIYVPSDLSFEDLWVNHTKYYESKYYEILWLCATSIKYDEFYEAWHFQSMSNYPEIVAYSPSDNTNKIQTLESQLIDCEAIQKELDLNADHPEICCLVVDIHQLEEESDPNVIAKKLTNKIFNSIGRRIPVVQDISCLKRELLNLKFDLGVEKLAIALYGKSTNEAIDQLCQNLAESVPIRPFTGEKSTQELVTQINAWLSEM